MAKPKSHRLTRAGRSPALVTLGLFLGAILPQGILAGQLQDAYPPVSFLKLTSQLEPLQTESMLTEGRLRVGKKTYHQSLSGLRSYLNDAQGTHPNVFKSLNPELRALESRNDWGWNLAVAGPLGGAGLGLAGAYAFPTESSSGSGSSASASSQPNLAIFFGGIALGLLAGLTGFYLMPDFHDLDRFIQRHNQVSPNLPMTIEYGPPKSTAMLGSKSLSAQRSGRKVGSGEQNIYWLSVNLFF